MTPDIRIVLVEPSHPGNIGAVARAMKNMGLAHLTLVRPKEFPHAEATARASGADDLLARARVVDSLPEALEGCGFVVATTSRERDQYFRVLDVREGAGRLVAEAQRAPAAVLFGAERTGLANEHLDAAHALLRIPANPEYVSLNLAMSVQLVAYEIHRAAADPVDRSRPALATPEEMGRLYVHLEEVLEQIDFRDRTESGVHLMQRIRRFLQRAELDGNEVNIVRGILTAVQNRRRRAGEGTGRAGPQIYLDHAATTPVDPEVAAEMARYLTADGDFGNPASTTHGFGSRAAELVTKARTQVAALIAAAADDIVFTSGATESNNLAILGVARGSEDKRHIVTSRTEHKAVLDPVRQLEREGWSVSWLTPDRDGLIDPQRVREALRPDTALVSIMHVNNELGVIQDIAAIGAVCRAHGVLFHSDAAQSAGKLPIDVRALPVDLLSFTAHKIYGPKGVGALYVRREARGSLRPLVFGGGQERGLRPGTLPTHQIAGLGAACARAARSMGEDAARLTRLRDRLWRGIAGLGRVHLNGHPERRVAGILNASFEGVEGESLIAGLRELAVSRGSACDSAGGEPSAVLRALGRSAILAQSSLRFGLGRDNTDEDVERAIAAIRREVVRLRGLSPAAPFVAPGAEWQGDAVVRGESGSEAQGAWIRFHLLAAGDTVKAARVQVYGCPHTVEVAQWLAERLPGRARGGLIPEGPLDWARARSVPPEKLGRLLVIEDALRNCIARWTSDLHAPTS